MQRLWAYITLAATGIVTEEASPLVGGLMAHDGHLKLVAVGAWITAGTWIADILLYYLGRWRGDWLRDRWPKLRAFMLRVFAVVRRHPYRCSLAVRWAYGLRLTLPLACGAARVPFWLYAVSAVIVVPMVFKLWEPAKSQRTTAAAVAPTASNASVSGSGTCAGIPAMAVPESVISASAATMRSMGIVFPSCVGSGVLR